MESLVAYYRATRAIPISRAWSASAPMTGARAVQSRSAVAAVRDIPMKDLAAGAAPGTRATGSFARAAAAPAPCSTRRAGTTRRTRCSTIRLSAQHQTPCYARASPAPRRAGRARDQLQGKGSDPRTPSFDPRSAARRRQRSAAGRLEPVESWFATTAANVSSASGGGKRLARGRSGDRGGFDHRTPTTASCCSRHA